MNRICIYPKDIQRITGKSERYGRNLIQKLRNSLGKKPHQFITIKEFSDYSGIDIEIINRYITD
jgi:hypothetical protein